MTVSPETGARPRSVRHAGQRRTAAVCRQRRVRRPRHRALPASARQLPEALRQRLETGVDVENPDSLAGVLAKVRPDVVINCVGVVKQLAEADDPLAAIPINALLPHRLARCAPWPARGSCTSAPTACSPGRAMYTEADFADANDLYGRSKYLGEVDYPNAVTLRTSIIGHELASAHGLVGWFLSQHGTVKGFRRAVFSGLPTQELARVMRDQVLPRPELHGVYHVSADPINKYELLMLVAEAYGKAIEIQPTSAW